MILPKLGGAPTAVVAERLRCRWCAYSVPRFYSGRDGKPKSGWGRLNAHAEERHPDEWEALQAQLGDPVEPQSER